MGEVKKLNSSIKSGGGPKIDVGATGANVVNFGIHVSRTMVHVDIIGLGVTLNLAPLDAVNLANNILRAEKKVRDGLKQETMQKLGLIKEMPAVKLKVPKVQGHAGPVFNPQTGRYE